MKNSKDIKILVVGNAEALLRPIAQELHHHGFLSVVAPTGKEVRHGHVTVSLIDRFESAQHFIAKHKPRVLITEWHLDKYHRQTKPPKGDGGAYLAQYALDSHGCERVVCIQSTDEDKKLPSRILGLLGRQGNNEYVLEVFETQHIYAMPRHAHSLTAYILRTSQVFAHPAIYGPSRPLKEVKPALQLAR